MTTYCGLTDLKTYVGTDKTDDDTLLSDCIVRASQRIDTYCKRQFVARTETRQFHAIEDVEYHTLYLDDDLLAVNTVTNGDGETISASSYVLRPANRYPKYAIRLKSSASVSWDYQTDPEEAISINGSWGFANTQPEDIKQACIRLSAWYYAQRDAPFETQGMPELGVVSVPVDVPTDVRAILDGYVRESIGGL